MAIKSPEELTNTVLEHVQRAPDPRFREIMSAAVRHLHGFVRDVHLTELEFQQACNVIARLGQLTTASHNEVVLTAGSLGISSLVCLLNNRPGESAAPTTANLMGPFWRDESPPAANGSSVVRSPTAGDPLFVRALILDEVGKPVAGARVDVWHASSDGFYENMDPGQSEMNLRGRFTTDAKGEVWFQTIKPSSYPVPVSGVAGDLLRAQGRHNMRPAHVHFMIQQQGYKTQFSQVYASDDEYVETDAQFGVTAGTLGDYKRHTGEAAPDGREDGVWFSLEHTFRLEPGESRLPPAPVREKTQGPRPELERLQAR